MAVKHKSSAARPRTHWGSASSLTGLGCKLIKIAVNDRDGQRVHVAGRWTVDGFVIHFKVAPYASSQARRFMLHLHLRRLLACEDEDEEHSRSVQYSTAHVIT